MKIPRMIAPLMGVLSALLFGGCATVTRGTKDTLVVESDPAGANVQLSTGQSGKTPTSFKLSRKKPFVVTISRDGYETVNVNVNSQIVGAGAAGMTGNVLVGGLIGIGVDAFSGATKSLKPNPLVVKLVKIETPSAPSALPTPAVVTASDDTQRELLRKLEDLKAALDKGLISTLEYDRGCRQLFEADYPKQTDDATAASSAVTTAGSGASH